MSEPWPWWLGALALAAVGLGFFVSSGNLLGVSGIIGRLVDPPEPELEPLQAAMLAETIAQFGPQTASLLTEPAAPEGAPRLSFTAQLAFLLMLLAGGILGQLSMGGWKLQLTLGDTFDRLWGTGGLSFVALISGGLLVGFGTRLAGGCTSGHGLSGLLRMAWFGARKLKFV